MARSGTVRGPGGPSPPWSVLGTVVVLAACGTRPTGTERPPEVEPPPPPRVALPSTPLNDPTADAPFRDPEGLAFPDQATTGGGDLLSLEEDHQAAREGGTAHAFLIRRLGLRRLVHCATASVLNEDGTGGGAAVEVAQGFGLPPEGWFLVFDPAGRAPGAVSLAWYRHLARYHRLAHLGTQGGLEFYRYLGPRPPLGE